MSIRFSRVHKKDVPDGKRFQRGKYAEFFDQLMDLPGGMSACVSVDSLKEGHYTTQALRALAKEENLILGWSRNNDGTAFYYWLDRPKAELRRLA